MLKYVSEIWVRNSLCWNYFWSFRLKNIYAEDYEKTIESSEENRMENDIVWSDEDLINEVRGTTNYFLSRAKSIEESGEKRVVIIDVLILVVGTLIWGFEDLIL